MRLKNQLLVLALMVLIVPAHASDSNASVLAEGTLRPDGPPQQRPVRVDAGKSCIVDVEQAYVVEGTLTGSFIIDYRILVVGPCGSPLGAFDEEWIARGKFTGAVNGVSASASFTYTAVVKAGGEVTGRIVLGQGLGGNLRIKGNFGDGKLAYEGQLTVIGLEKQ